MLEQEAVTSTWFPISSKIIVTTWRRRRRSPRTVRRINSTSSTQFYPFYGGDPVI